MKALKTPKSSLARLIDHADKMSAEKIAEMGRKAKRRVAKEYTWDKICGQYEEIFKDGEDRCAKK